MLLLSIPQEIGHIHNHIFLEPANYFAGTSHGICRDGGERLHCRRRFCWKGWHKRFQPASRIAGISIDRSWNLRFFLLHPREWYWVTWWRSVFCYIGAFDKLQTPSCFATTATCRIGLPREEDSSGAYNVHPAASSTARMERDGAPDAATPRRGASTAVDGGYMSAMAKLGGDPTMTELRTRKMVGRGSDTRGTCQAGAAALSATATRGIRPHEGSG